MTYTATITAIVGNSDTETYKAWIIEAVNERANQGLSTMYRDIINYVLDNHGDEMTEGDLKPTLGHGGQKFSYEARISYVASLLKDEGTLIREDDQPWLLVGWSGERTETILTAYRKAQAPAPVITCNSCFTVHGPAQIECW